MWSRRFLALLITALAAFPATAFDRPFPQGAKRGSMTPGWYPAVVIDGKSRNLSPGARIWNQDNLIEMPASLRGSDMTVNYTENTQGDIDRVWILTKEEASRPLAK
jgi:hypothetical protein